MDKTALLKIENLCVGYKGGALSPSYVAGPINTEMYAGELICLLGTNGAGKSTFLRTIAGLQKKLEGGVLLNNERVEKMKPIKLAKKLSLVLTDSVRSGNLDVYSLISLGRYPYSGWLGNLSSEDRKIIEWAAEATDVTHFLDRKIGQLSDGECQKVMLARALAQDTGLIILDEPTAHLDLPSRIELMRLLHKLARDTNKGILISTHELDLALQVADKIWLLKRDGQMETGIPEDLILSGTFESVFDKAGVLFDRTTGTFSIHENSGKYIQVIGVNAAAFWTRRALLRNGFVVNSKGRSDTIIEVVESNNTTTWIVDRVNAKNSYNSVAELLEIVKR